jgi:hypothetical protein
LVMRSVIGVTALPMSIWPQAMSYCRPSSEVDLVRPAARALVPHDLHGFCVHRNGPVKLAATTESQVS